MAEPTKSELKTICRVLAHFVDGGWPELVELLDEEAGKKLYDNVESAHAKLSRMSRGKSA